MLSRIKFRIVGGEYAGKYVCNIENGKMVFFNRYFRPQERDGIDTCFALIVEDNRTQIDFVGSNFLWNGKALAPVIVTVNTGDALTWETHSIEILDCPMQVAAHGNEKTKFLDISSVGKAGIPPTPMDEPPRKKPTNSAPLSLTPIPKNGGSIIAPIPGSENSKSFSQVESSLMTPGFGSDIAAPEIFDPENPSIPEKIVVKSNEFKKALFDEDSFLAEKSKSNINITASSEGVLLTPMRRSFGMWYQVATIFVIFVCFGAYVYKRYLVAQWNLEQTAQKDIVLPKANEEQPVQVSEESVAVNEPSAEPVRELASTATPIPEVMHSGGVKEIESTATPIAPIEAKASEVENHAALFAAIDTNDIPKVKMLMDGNAMSLDFTDSTGKTPITYAASMGRLSILKIFSAHKADLNMKDSEGYTALMHAVMNEKKATIEFLIEQGVDRKYKRADGKNAFAMAKEKNKDLLKLFTKRAPSSKK